MKRVIVPLADGFEEIEAISVIDILRRAGIAVTTVSLAGTRVTGSHGIAVEADMTLEQADVASADGLVLPGGMPGTTRLGESTELGEALCEMDRSGRLVAAICAAPTVLNRLGILGNRAATSHPAHAGEMDRCHYREERVVTDGHVITSRGAGTAIEFAAVLVGYLLDAETADDILSKIQFS